jgi:hypothetical protein
MTYNKLFPVSLSYQTRLIPKDFESKVYSDQSLKCAIWELGACEAYMYLKNPDSKQFWLGHPIIDTVRVLIVGWDKDNWLIQYNDEIYRLPFIHFMELKTIKAAPFN